MINVTKIEKNASFVQKNARIRDIKMLKTTPLALETMQKNIINS